MIAAELTLLRRRQLVMRVVMMITAKQALVDIHPVGYSSPSRMENRALLEPAVNSPADSNPERISSHMCSDDDNSQADPSGHTSSEIFSFVRDKGSRSIRACTQQSSGF